VKYSKYIVTFIDVMGFKDLVEKRYAADSSPVRSIIDALRETNAICGKYRTPGGLDVKIKSHAFSDSIVRRIRVEEKSQEYIMRTLDWELFQLALMQISLLEDGVFIRGCMNIGPMYARQEVFFGEAFNEAYRIESKEAVNPVIVLSQSVVDCITTYPHYQGYELLSTFGNPNMKYNHSYTYLNYLYLIKTLNLLTDRIQIEKFIVSHRDRVQDEISRNLDNVQVLMKYLWLKELHNHYVKQMEPFADRADLLIG